MLIHAPTADGGGRSEVHGSASHGGNLASGYLQKCLPTDGEAISTLLAVYPAQERVRRDPLMREPHGQTPPPPPVPIHTRSSCRIPSLCRMHVSLPTTRVPKNTTKTRGGARGALYRTSVLSTGKYHGADSVSTCTPKQWCTRNNARDSDGHNGEGSDWHLAVVEMPRTWSLMSLFKSPERFQSAEERAAKGRGDPATADG